MADQPRYDPLEPSRFFADGQSARPPVPGPVPRGGRREGPAFLTGRKSEAGGKGPSLEQPGEYVDAFPFRVTAAVLERGRERYGIYCAPCHGASGNGAGKVVEHGYPPAESFHSDRLCRAPSGYFIDVMTRGGKTMPPYAKLVAPADRWAVAAYVRVLQRSGHGRPEGDGGVETAMRDLAGRLPVWEEGEREPEPPEWIPTDAGSGRYVRRRQP
jgi:mono/diheme cytochrome c family protein